MRSLGGSDYSPGEGTTELEPCENLKLTFIFYCLHDYMCTCRCLAISLYYLILLFGEGK